MEKNAAEEQGQTLFDKLTSEPNEPMSIEEGNDVLEIIEDDMEVSSIEGLLRGDEQNLSSFIGDSFELEAQDNWIRPYWLGSGLFLTLFTFWMLDSLKDPIFGHLVNGNLEVHQPTAKLCSVATTLAVVCLMEFLSKPRSKRMNVNSNDEVLSGGGRWQRMSFGDVGGQPDMEMSDRVSVMMFAYVGVSYAAIFVGVNCALQYHPAFSVGSETSTSAPERSLPWHFIGYALYAIIESYGSISVATFWSYTNSTLSLHDAECFYGLIIAIAQLGAIGGSTMVTTHWWSSTQLLLMSCLMILLQATTMYAYDKRFKPTSDVVAELPTPQASNNNNTSVVPFGVQLIMKHPYVVMLLGVSCLYEISLTCLDYQMKLLGWSRFDGNTKVSFATFMGRYGQVTNFLSLIFSSILFPFLIRKFGLRLTLRLFPTLLVLATVVTFGILPTNLAALFLSLTLLKAMTYSIHDPAKEILYLPTSNAIKFRAKYWIDVVGARVAKAVGSSINFYAGGAPRAGKSTMEGVVESRSRGMDRIVAVGSLPSIFTACALWYVCYRIGLEFDRLVREKRVVGQGNDDRYERLSTIEDLDVDDDVEGFDDEFSASDDESDGGPPQVIELELPALR